MKYRLTIIMFILFTLFLCACDKTPSVSLDDDSSFLKNQSSYCMIDLRGEVMYPGIYKVESGTLINEVIKLAGGVTKNANLETINLVSVVDGNMKIIIPSITTNDQVDTSKININTCTAEDLQTIPKIGKVKANAIIEYRNEHGLFSNIEELMKVSGIGNALFEEIKIYLTV